MGKRTYATWLYEVRKFFLIPRMGLTAPHREWNEKKVLLRVHDACDKSLMVSRDNQQQLGHAIDRIRENLDWMENFQDGISKRTIHKPALSVAEVPADAI